ncbi:hypothetical protein B0J14DRAFT_587059 [Halenospora varia]|nr:hypothetical protein B0J14DRAFT_587059 [Halenospora varia]
MASIYESYYVTIAATTAGDCETGFLTKRMWNSITVSFGNDTYVIYSKYKAPHADFGRQHFWFPPSSRHPLFHRGWVLQEQLLAARVLHFTQNKIFLGCGDSPGCECVGNTDWGDDYVSELREDTDAGEDEHEDEREDREGSTKSGVKTRIATWIGIGIWNRTRRRI